MIDIPNSELFCSQKTYKKRISEDHVVLFQPDVVGLPVVLDNLAYDVYSSFKEGNKVIDVVNAYVNQGHNKDKIYTFLKNFTKDGFLNNFRSNIGYVPQDFKTVNDIKSFGMWVHITNNCNLNCGYCFVHKKTPNSMNLDTVGQDLIKCIRTTIEKYSIKRITIKYAGGEPLLALDKIESFHTLLNRNISDLNVKYHAAILSNGTLINEKVINFLQKTGIGISISLDGYGEAGHDRYRRFKNTENGSWNIVSRNIDLLIKYGIRPYIMGTISKESCNSLKDLVSWIFSRNLRARLSVVRQLDSDWSTEKNSELEYKKYNELLIDNFEEAFSELEKPDYYIDYSKGEFELCDFRFRTPSLSACCDIASNHIIVSEEGKLASCPMCVNEANVDVSNHDLLLSIKKTFSYSPLERNSDIKRQMCLYCKWYPVCVGSCPVTNMRILGHPFTTSMFHDFCLYAIPRYIEFCGKKLLQYAKKKDIKNFHILRSIV